MPLPAMVPPAEAAEPAAQPEPVAPGGGAAPAVPAQDSWFSKRGPAPLITRPLLVNFEGRHEIYPNKTGQGQIGP